jgi:AraC family transcriptional regulator, positive regulator of tynA and feaB
MAVRGISRDELPGATPSTISTLTETVVRLLGDHIIDGEHVTGRAIRHGLLADRVLKCLEANFTDPDYSVTRLAEAVGISRRYVDALFAKTDSTFGKALLEKRLERCHRLLRDPQFNDRSVTDVAFDSGFNDLSHFCKCFRERYGVAARTIRMPVA